MALLGSPCLIIDHCAEDFYNHLPFECTEITREFLIQIRLCGVVTECVAMSFHIVTHTLPTSSSTVNSLMTAGSPFFVVTDLTVCYVVGMVVVDTNSEIYNSVASSS